MKTGLNSPFRLVLGLALLVALGTLALLLPGVGAERPLTWNEALFTAVSALSVTGLSIIQPGRNLTLPGQIILLALIQIGGVGFMTVAVVVFQLLGRKISFEDRLVLRDSLGLVDMQAILRLTKHVLQVSLAIELSGAFVLWLNWRSTLGEARAAFYALFHAVSAFCNAGFDLFTGLNGRTGIPTDPLTLAVLGILILIGGLGIPVISELFTLRPRFSLHTRLTLLVSTGLFTAGALGLFLAERQPGGTLAGLPTVRQLGLASFQSISARTAGFSGIDDFAALTPASQLLKIALMFVGSAPASMGGGITTGTLAVLALALWAYARGRETATFGGRAIAAGTVRRAGAVLTFSLFLVLTATWLLLLTHPAASLDAAFFEVVSAFATCGLSLAFTGQLNLFGQLLIVFMMFWGRLGALTIMVLLARTSSSSLLHYPEEQVLIG